MNMAEIQAMYANLLCLNRQHTDFPDSLFLSMPAVREPNSPPLCLPTPNYQTLPSDQSISKCNFEACNKTLVQIGKTSSVGAWQVCFLRRWTRPTTMAAGQNKSCSCRSSDYALRRLQIVAFGDFLQLPPVLGALDNGNYAFKSSL